MSIRNLELLFNPRSVAVIGASERAHSVGATVLHNLLSGGFRGPVYPVNPRHQWVGGQRAYPDVAALPETPELALICTPAASVAGIIDELGRRGTRAAVILSAGMHDDCGDGRSRLQATLDAARPFLLRILGPNCVGLLVPGIGLNASFSHAPALPGHTAFVSQSGALVTGVLDWASSRGIGFSRCISLGDSADVDFGDVLDFLAGDRATNAIVLYMEDVRHARKFMSAARAAARAKPVVVLKSGRAPEGARAAASHTGALAGADLVYDSAFRRAGMLRVHSTVDLFGAVETLARARTLPGERLAILTNGGGPGVLATDELMCGGGALAQLAPHTMARLDALLPATWSRGNPVDIIGDAPALRYVDALQVLLEDSAVDAVLLIHAPTAIVASAAIAQALVPLAAAAHKNVIGCWLGGDSLAAARSQWQQAGLLSFDTPEEAVHGFLQMAQYRRNQQLMLQVPPAAPPGRLPERATAAAAVAAALADGRAMLSEQEVLTVLCAYGIVLVASRRAADDAGALAAAHAIGFPVALKVVSPDLSHKSDVGGVALDLADAPALLAALAAMRARLARLAPQARLEGWTVQAMVRRPDALELIAGAATDPVFGPVILFGQGGIAVEIIGDRALALPPLDLPLARDLVMRTTAGTLLRGYRGRPPADLDAVCEVLIRLGHLMADLPGVLELDINPLLADHNGAIALDARMRVAQPRPGAPHDRLAIRPYPDQYQSTFDWQGQRLTLRPIQPGDAAAHVAFFRQLDPEDVRLRMFVNMHEMSPAQLARFTQIDYDREMAFIVTRTRADGSAETLGVARAVADPDNREAEFAVTVRSDLKGQGLGRLLMQALIDYSRARGTLAMTGEVLAHNTGMLRLAASLGFAHGPADQDGVVHLQLPLQARVPAGSGHAGPRLPS